MKHKRVLVLLFGSVLFLSGCAMRDVVWGLFGDHYSVTDVAPTDREHHFDQQLDRWNAGYP